MGISWNGSLLRVAVLDEKGLTRCADVTESSLRFGKACGIMKRCLKGPALL